MTNVLDINDYRAPVRLPADLRNANGWLVWRLTQKTGEPKPRKIPFYVSGSTREGSQGGDLDRKNLVPFERAVAACVKGHYTGVGFAMLKDWNLIALDFDNCIKDGEIDAEVRELVIGTYAEFSPSGNGIRAFFRGFVPDRKDHNKQGKYPFAVEFFCAKGYVTITGNVLPDCELFGCEETIADVTPGVLALYEKRFGVNNFTSAPTNPTSVEDDGGNWLINVSSKIGLSLVQVKAGLDVLDANCGYEEWLHIGQSLHHEFDGSDEAFELWREWSSESVKYPGDRALEAKWASFGRYVGSPLTAAYFLKKVKEGRVAGKYEALESWRNQIKDATDEFDLRERLCPKIAEDATLGEMEREALAYVLLDKLRALGMKYPIAQVRKLVAEKRLKKPLSETHLPEWAKGWVYVTDEDKFFRLDSDEWLTMQAFNARFNREVPYEEGEAFKSAAWLCLENYNMPTVTRAMYVPWADGLFESEGVKCANKYRPSSIPKASGGLSAAGREAIALVERHIFVICGNRPEVAATLVAWLAHNVQHPGVKIRWAPLIKGIEGDGKSLIGSLLVSVLGRANVNEISPGLLGEKFNGWAEGACVGVLEELKMTGHNRYDILNALKPLITNGWVTIRRMNNDAYGALNTMNYIAFTNFTDALPLNDTDRRWWILFTPFADINDLAASLGLPVGGVGKYFDALHGAIQTQRAELRQWLLDYPIPESFKPNEPAPLTDEKEVMISMTRSPEEEVAQEIIEAGAEGVSKLVLSSSCLTTAMLMHDEGISIATSAVSRLLSKLGWTKVSKPVKWNGKTHRVWTRGKVSSDGRPENEVLREFLDRTLSGSQKLGDDYELLFN